MNHPPPGPRRVILGVLLAGCVALILLPGMASGKVTAGGDQEPGTPKPIRDCIEEYEHEFVSENDLDTSSEKERLARLKSEALEAFGDIRRSFLDKDYEAIWGRVLDDGHPISAKEMAKLRKPGHPTRQEYRADVDRTAKLLVAVPEDMAPGKTIVGALPDRDDIVVAVEFPHTAEPVREAARQALALLQRSHFTFTKQGDLVIVMRRIDGKWYWNPLGW